jgi:hypothetical protein
VDADTEESVTSEEETDKAKEEGKEKWVAIKNTAVITTPVVSTTEAAADP